VPGADVVGAGVDEAVVVLPGRRGGRREGRRVDRDAALAEPAGQEVKIPLDQGLTGVERDDGGLGDGSPCTSGANLAGILSQMPDGTPPPTPVPGVVVVWSGATPTVQAFRIPQAGLILGRELLENTTDDRISRQHARVMWRDKRFVVTDLGSRNGTYAGGHALVDREVTVTPPSVVRTGRTVVVLLEDIRKFEGATMSSKHDAIVGASTSMLWAQVEQAAHDDTNLLLLGEPGSGKGRMARGYARTRNRPEAVFNPTIQAVPLERVCGPTIETLILEQVGKLGAANLATLTKLLESRPGLRIVTTAVMQLEHLGIPPEVAARLAARVHHLPPLRDRPDEMAYLVHDAVRGAEPALQIHSTLIEACLLRPWPGNSRELVSEVSRTAHTVAAQGKNNIRGEDLDNDAGHLMVGAPTLNAAVQPTAVGGKQRRARNTRPSGRSD
jgi:hypothetical protein